MRARTRQALLATAGIGAAVACVLYARSDAAREVVEVRKQLWIDVPVDEVFGFWHRLENLPRVMPHLVAVRDLGDGLSHWTAHGPAGVPVTWRARTTFVAPRRGIAWASEPGSAIRNAGRVRFDPEAGGTIVDVRLSYHAPGGALGAFAARLFGADPASGLDEDLLRVKALLETGRTIAHGRTVTREELQPELGVQGV